MHSRLDCLVVGGGPAGLTAAIYLRRFHRNVLVCDAADSRARRIPLTRNYPGFPGGISGDELLERLREQLRGCGGELRPATVQRLRSLPGAGFAVDTDDGSHCATTVVIATGVEDVIPPLPGALELLQARRLRFCPICDGYDFTGRRIAVIGSGQHGVRESLFIRRYSEDIVHLGWGGLHDEARRELEGAGVRVIDGDARTIEDRSGQELLLTMHGGGMHRFDVVYIALGIRTRSRLAVELGARCDEHGGLIVDPHARTSVDGLYAAGDVVHGLDQIVVGMGQAALAATHIHNRLPP